MWKLMVLFALWIASMHYFLPLPIVVILFAALVSGTTVTIGFALMKRRNPVPVRNVIEGDAKREFLEKVA
jgi:hypothetical protein